jgi:hypothetical protein
MDLADGDVRWRPMGKRANIEVSSASDIHQRLIKS